MGKRLYIYGPEGITLSDAMDRFAAACYPDARVIHLRLWQARLLAKVIRNAELAEVTELIAYLDKAGEHGEPALADELFGAPALTQVRSLDPLLPAERPQAVANASWNPRAAPPIFGTSKSSAELSLNRTTIA